MPVTQFSALYNYTNMSNIHSLTDIDPIRLNKCTEKLLRPTSKKHGKLHHFKQESK
jgi:hypothetical protein